MLCCKFAAFAVLYSEKSLLCSLKWPAMDDVAKYAALQFMSPRGQSWTINNSSHPPDVKLSVLPPRLPQELQQDLGNQAKQRQRLGVVISTDFAQTMVHS